MAILPSNPRLPSISCSIHVALLYSQVLLLMLIPGILVFHYAWHNYHSCGLYVLTYFPGSPFFKRAQCRQALVVRLESNGEWYSNSRRIEPESLPDALRTQMDSRTGCLVFFDAKPEVLYAEAIHAIDLIEQSSERVVLLTPKTKTVHIP